MPGLGRRMQYAHTQPGGKPRGFCLPVANQCSRHYQQCRTIVQYATRFPYGKQGECLQGFAQAHIICQANTGSHIQHTVHIAHPLVLVGAQYIPQSKRYLRQRSSGSADRMEQFRERMSACVFHSFIGSRQHAGRLRYSGQQAQSLYHGQPLLPDRFFDLFPSGEQLLNLLCICHHPLTTQLHQRPLRSQ